MCCWASALGDRRWVSLFLSRLTGEHQLLLRMLAQQESGPSFSASGVALGRLQLPPLLRALKLQAPLQRLSLSGTGLGDDVAEELLACLGTLPRLKALDLSAAQLGPEGLRKLTAGLPGSSPWQVCVSVCVCGCPVLLVTKWGRKWWLHLFSGWGGLWGGPRGRLEPRGVCLGS